MSSNQNQKKSSSLVVKSNVQAGYVKYATARKGHHTYEPESGHHQTTIRFTLG